MNEINIKYITKCKYCEGAGECQTCGGWGKFMNMKTGISKDCPECKGRGLCPDCTGTGIAPGQGERQK